MIRRQYNSKRQSRRSGLLSMELIMVLPILMIMLFGLFEFALLFSARGQVVDAAQAGVRAGTLHGVGDLFIEEEVRRSLSHNLAVNAKIDTLLGEYSGDEVLVRVRVPMTAASPDLLWPIGYSIQRRDLIAEARMLKE